MASQQSNKNNKNTTQSQAAATAANNDTTVTTTTAASTNDDRKENKTTTTTVSTANEILSEQDAASLLAIGIQNVLPLQFRWALWYSAPKTQEAEGSHKWDTERQKQIVEFGSVEEFWRVFNNLTPPSKLSIGSDLQLFRSGVTPAWEDPFNAKGGTWTIKINKDDSNKFDTVWFNTVLTMIGDNFDDADDICGISVASRSKFNRIQLWTRYADDANVSKRIGAQLKDVNRLKSSHKILFLSHDDEKSRVTGADSGKPSEIIL